MNYAKKSSSLSEIGAGLTIIKFIGEPDTKSDHYLEQMTALIWLRKLESLRRNLLKKMSDLVVRGPQNEDVKDTEGLAEFVDTYKTKT